MTKNWKPQAGAQAIVVKANATHHYPINTRVTVHERLNNRLYIVSKNLNPNDRQILDVIEFAPT